MDGVDKFFLVCSRFLYFYLLGVNIIGQLDAMQGKSDDGCVCKCSRPHIK